MKTMQRKLDKHYTPASHPGFLGAGHVARPVIQDGFKQSDPFIILMDDQLDKQNDDPAGGPHPHAGFETVTLVLEGELGTGEHKMTAGDFQMMTAGSGVVHTETIDKKIRMRILQLWLTLPRESRWTTPRVQDLPLKDVPTRAGHGSLIRVYSGSFAGVTSPVLNHVPLIVADIHLQPGVTTRQSLPASYNTFMYVLDGNVSIGEERRVLQQDEVGWLDRMPVESPSELVLTAGKTGVRVVLYAAEPQGDDIVAHGPFIADTEQDIRRLYSDYRQGKMKHVTTLPEEQTLVW